MAKRFIDTSIWNKQWYRKLGAAEKVAWLYLLTSCDAVGVWDADLELAEFSIGSKVDWEALRTAANGNIEVLDNGKWWVVDFCKYQHGDLMSHKNSAPIRCYLSLLSKHGLIERVEEQFEEGLPNSCQTVKGKGIGKGKGEGLGTGEGTGKGEVATVDPLYHVVEQAFLSKNDGRFTNYGKEGKAIHGLMDKAKARMPDDPASLLSAMLDAFWRLKTGDTSAKGFWRGQPFLPSALSPLWDRVLETMRDDVVDPAIMAIIKGEAT